ncbi:MAG: peptide chain release factor, partial [Dehalococcoidia bacterium]|nr:peptide chain release factor [Dehalococcoidia bacterium]
LEKLEAASVAPEFWSDPQQAQDAMRRVAELRESVSTWKKLGLDAATARELCDLLESEQDPAMESQLAKDTADIASRLAAVEFQLSFQGPHDGRNAILAIHAGAGGTESQDWAQMLLRMYVRWAERKGFSAEILDSSPGEQAGIKSVTVEIRGRNGYGQLKSERGVHRLVRLSPFDADHARHTSFALVEVLPEAESEREVNISPDDLRIDIFHAGGHGGQNVQKVSTAVRMVHLPTGTTVTVQNERSQRQNRETAMLILMARLMEIEEKKRLEEHDRLKGEHVSAAWGNQIRSYVLHPYKLVKDHRTGLEDRNPNAILDGDLDGMIQSYLTHIVGSGI